MENLLFYQDTIKYRNIYQANLIFLLMHIYLILIIILNLENIRKEFIFNISNTIT
jgi:hypothetical protein